MDTDLVAPATPTETPAPVGDDTSIADHEAQFGKGRSAEPASTEEPPKPRHRAKSQEATPQDSPRIAELTKKWRDAERRAEDAERRANERIPTTERRQETAIAETKTAITEKPSDKPSWKTFEDQIGTKFETWADAQDAYVDARDDWKDAQGKKTQAETQQLQAQQTVLQGYSTKAQEYAKTTPDFFDKMAAAAPVLDGIPDLLFQSIVRHDNGPEIAYYLVGHPSDLDDMCLVADGKSVTDASVALLQRRLSHYRTLAASTGSAAAPIPRAIAPRPPNPVRTGPQKTSDELPGDDASIAEHERAFGKRRR